jgi:intein-encoded DNA endonuclease-like protein
MEKNKTTEVSKKEAENIILLYNNGIGTNKLAKFFGRHRSTIQYQLIKNKVKLRKGSPKFAYNVKYFDTYSPESCYWAGYILADGCLRSKRKTLEIKTIDEGYLEKFSNSISYEGKIHKRKNYFDISISGNWFYESLLVNFGIFPRKTFLTEVTTKIPKNLLSHYIRGFFDGDGCVTYTSCPTINFTSGTYKMLTQLVEIFYEIGVRIKNKSKLPKIQNTNLNAYQLSYSGKNAQKILEWMYKDSNENIRLTRKYNKYISLFK